MASEQNHVQILSMAFVEFLSPKIAIFEEKQTQFARNMKKQQICWDKNS
jgi:hypothetical protein